MKRLERMLLMVAGMSLGNSVSANAQTETPDSAQMKLLEKYEALYDSIEVKETTVSAKKPLMVQKDDRAVYDMKNDPEAKTNTVMEMMKKVPFVSTDKDGNLQIKGSGNIRIYKDGRQNNSLTSNAKQILTAIPASMLERVEVITEPGAKYDAEGVDGIINLVFRKDFTTSGVMGQVTAMTSEQSDPVGNIYLATKLGKVDLSASYTYDHLIRGHHKQDVSQEYHYNTSGNDLTADILQEFDGQVHVVGLEGSYEIDSLNLISVALDGHINNIDIYGHGDIRFHNGASTIYSFHDNYDNSKQSAYAFDGKVDFQHLTHRKGEILTGSYLFSTTDSHQQVGENYSDWVNRPDYYNYKRYFTDDDGLFVEHTLQIDWERPITDAHRLNVGAKYINRRNTSDGKQEHDDQLFSKNDFSHITNVAAAYAEYRYTNPKWSASAGMRYEYARLDAKFKDGSAEDYSRNLNDLVPFASLTYRLNATNTLRLNYSSRVERPGITYLNPFRSEDMLQIQEGNPYLESSRPNKIALSHSYMSQKLMTNFTLNAAFNNDGIGDIINIHNDKVYSTYGNIQKYNAYTADAYIRWQPTAKTNLTVNMNGGRVEISNPSLGMDQNRWFFAGNLRLAQELFWKMILTINAGRYEYPLNDIYSHSGVTYWHGFNLQRSFLKEDRLTVKVGAANPFKKTQVFNQYTTQGDMVGVFEQQSPQRWVGVSVAYRFGKLNSTVKKAQKTITNDDLVGQSKKEK